MDWRIKRKYKKSEYTIGKFYINGKEYCDTLEDRDRGLSSSMNLAEIKSQKVYSKTAIPTGRYKVKMAYWSKYKRNVPMICNVPGYTGILIHNGVDEDSTSGCPLVGENRAPGKLTNGRKYMNELTDMVADCKKRGEEIWITIE